METMDNAPILSVRSIDKSFPGVQALRDISLDFRAGEIHAVCGENGAGKSTLMHILAGAYRADSGDIFLGGRHLEIHSQAEANRLGISIVYQERSLVPGLTVGENIYADRQPRRFPGIIDWTRLHQEAKAFLLELQLDIDPRTLVGGISAALQQMVEIAKALSVHPKVLILDEPTATVTERETTALFALLERLREQGLAIIYISHRLAEIFKIADRVSVLKDGELMGTEMVASIDERWIIKRMVGRDLYVTRSEMKAAEDRVLEVEGLSDGSAFTRVSFYLRRTEILTFSGLVGAGRTEVMKVIFGVRKRTEGKIRLFSEDVNISSPRDAIRRGIGYLPEDRKEQGLFLEMSVSDNIVASSLRKVQRFVEFDEAKAAELAEDYVSRLSIATPSVHQKTLNLSGGNQQKVVLAKWVLVDPKILIVDEPTRGVDVGAKLEIYAILRRLRDAGTSIIVVSSDLAEVVSLSDRVYVMYNGRITGEAPGEKVTEELLMSYASGIRDDRDSAAAQRGSL